MIHERRQQKKKYFFKKIIILNLYLTFVLIRLFVRIFVSSRRLNGTQPLTVHNNTAIELLATEHRLNPRKFYFQKNH